jgi:hypothetical protein
MANAITFPCDPGFIESFAQELEALPPKASAARHNVIRQLLPQIEGMLQKGYTLAGIVCSFETFRRHVRKAQAQRDEQRKHQETGTAIENPISNFGNQAAHVASSTSPPPVYLSQSAVHSVVSAQVAVEERSETQPMAEPIVAMSTDDSLTHQKTQDKPQQGVEPDTSALNLAQAIAEHPAATVPVAMKTVDGSAAAIGREGDSLESSEHELETEERFLALSTPRMSQEEKLQHFYRTIKRN